MARTAWVARRGRYRCITDSALTKTGTPIHMTETSHGTATYHTRVESWECDFNGHWNTKYYARSFEAASAVGAAMAGLTAALIAVRQVRFHRELVNGDAVEVRSFAVTDAESGPATAHCMLRDGVLVATCLDLATPPPAFLPPLDAQWMALAAPRGVVGPRQMPWSADECVDSIVELGPTQVGDYDHRGEIGIEHLMRFCAITSHTHAARIGFTLDYTKQTGVGRMLVELRLSRLGNCPAGTCLTAATRLVSTSPKAFVTANQLTTRAGEPIAMFELSTLAVDMKTRRATALPDILCIPGGA